MHTKIPLGFAAAVLLVLLGQTARADDRTLWRGDNVSFERVKDKQWQEKAGDDTHLYVELSKGDQFIEIFDKKRNVAIRLYADHYDLKVKGKFERKLDGKWEVAAGAAPPPPPPPPPPAPPKAGNPNKSDPIVGAYKWHHGDTVVIKDDGTMKVMVQDGQTGRWVVNPYVENGYVLMWRGGYVESHTLKENGKKLEGTGLTPEGKAEPVGGTKQ